MNKLVMCLLLASVVGLACCQTSIVSKTRFVSISCKQCPVTFTCATKICVSFSAPGFSDTVCSEATDCTKESPITNVSIFTCAKDYTGANCSAKICFNGVGMSRSNRFCLFPNVACTTETINTLDCSTAASQCTSPCATCIRSTAPSGTTCLDGESCQLAAATKHWAMVPLATPIYFLGIKCKCDAYNQFASNVGYCLTDHSLLTALNANSSSNFKIWWNFAAEKTASLLLAMATVTIALL